MRRLNTSRIPLALWGPLGALVILLAAFLAITGGSQFSSTGFQLQAVFRSDAQLGYGSPVRIAGIDVGTVTGVRPLGQGADGAVVTMSIDRSGLPIHRDATVKVRSRLLLEGNFYVDLAPGTPGAPAMRSGATIPAAQTSGPVQLDRVLSALPLDTRASLRTLLRGFGQALGGQPSPGEAASDDSSTRGETAGQALNQTFVNAPAALRGTAEVTQALLGTQPHDLSRLVGGTSLVLSALASRQDELAGLITNLDRTLGPLASGQAALGRSVALLPGVLGSADSALTSLDRSFRPTRAFMTQILPGVRALPPTIDAALPWIRQSGLLLGSDELGGLLKNLGPAVRDLTTTLSTFSSTLDQLGLLDRCLVSNILPSSKVQIHDPPLPPGGPVYREFFQTIAGLASASQGFDGNGHYIRAFGGGGANPVKTSVVPQQGPFRADAIAPTLGTRPAFPGKEPPYRTDVPCANSRPADLNAARTGATP